MCSSFLLERSELLKNPDILWSRHQMLDIMSPDTYAEPNFEKTRSSQECKQSMLILFILLWCNSLSGYTSRLWKCGSDQVWASSYEVLVTFVHFLFPPLERSSIMAWNIQIMPFVGLMQSYVVLKELVFCSHLLASVKDIFCLCSRSILISKYFSAGFTMGLVMELFLVLASQCHDTLGPYWTILFVRYSTNQKTLDTYSIQDSYILCTISLIVCIKEYCLNKKRTMLQK